MTDFSGVWDLEMFVVTTSSSYTGSLSDAQGWLRLPSRSTLSDSSSVTMSRVTSTPTREVPHITTSMEIPGIPSPDQSTTATRTTTTTTTTTQTTKSRTSTLTSGADSTAAVKPTTAGGEEAGTQRQRSVNGSERTLVYICVSLGGGITAVILLVVCFVLWRSRIRKRHHINRAVGAGFNPVKRSRLSSIERTRASFPGREVASAANKEHDVVTKDEQNTKNVINDVGNTERREGPVLRMWEDRASFVPSTPVATTFEGCAEDGDSNVTRFTPQLGRRQNVSSKPQAAQVAMQMESESGRTSPVAFLQVGLNGTALKSNRSSPPIFSEPKGLGIRFPDPGPFHMGTAEANKAVERQSMQRGASEASRNCRRNDKVEQQKHISPAVTSASRVAPDTRMPTIAPSPSSVYSPRPVHTSVRPAFIRAEADGDSYTWLNSHHVTGGRSPEGKAETTRTGFSSILRLYTDDGDSDSSGKV